MKKTRNRVKQTTSLQERIAAFADIFQQASQMPAGSTATIS